MTTSRTSGTTGSRSEPAKPGRWGRLRKAAGLVLAGALLVLAGYGIYLFSACGRLDDNLPLTPEGEGTGSAETGQVLRLVSYNIGFGAYSADYTFFMDGGTESRARSPEAVYSNVGGAVEAARALEGDFYLLQEVDVDGTRSHHIDEYQLIREGMGSGWQYVFAQNYDSPYLFWPPLSPHGANRSGMVTLSRCAVSGALRRSLPIEGGLMKLVDYDRCYSLSRVPTDNGRELVLYNLHLSAYTSDGSIAEEQLRILCADMLAEYEKGNYALAGGDFNKDLLGSSGEVFGGDSGEYTWAQPIPEGLIPPALSLAAPLQAEDPVPSCRNADQPYGPEDFVLTVDGFLHSPNIQAVSAWVEDTGFQWSDHNPVCLEFVLQA